MAEQNKTYITCRNGHQQAAVAGLKFCIHCGVPISAPVAQATQPPVQPNQPVQNNQPPVQQPAQANQPQNNQHYQANQPVQNQQPLPNNQQQQIPQNQQAQSNQPPQQNNQPQQQGGVNPFGYAPQQPNQNQPQQNQQYQQGNQNYQPNQPQNNQQFQQGNQNYAPNNQQYQQNYQQGNPNVPPQGNQNYQQQQQPNYQQQQQYPQQYNQQQQYQQNPQQMQQYQQQMLPITCHTCGGYGQGLPEKSVVCKDCGWLRPLLPGYKIDTTAFEWAADGKAMAALRAVTPLTMAASAVSEKVGRPWIESTFNGVLLSEKQLPHIYGLAVRAARILGMSHMPDVYLSGERSWDCLTFGTDKDSFVVIGSALAGNYQGEDLLFLLAREMGHCRAGHALWKTVIRFFLGEQGQSKGILAGGIFKAILNPTSLVTGAIEVPLLAWARQAEITADRAGILAVGNEDVVRRVLLSWSLKSMVMYRQINIDAWIEQQSMEDGYSRLTELTTSSTPYLGPRLKLLTEFARSQELLYWRKIIVNALRQAAPPPPPPQPAPYNPPPSSAALPKNIVPVKTAASAPKPPAPAKMAADKDFIKLKCAECQTPMRVPLKALDGKTELPVKCPNKACGKVTRLKKNVKKPAVQPAPPKPKNLEENMNYDD